MKKEKEVLLQEGDIIRLKAGHTVYIDIPEHFCYANRGGVFNKLARATVLIGRNHNGMDTDFLAGKYIVVRAVMDGGGTGHGPNDVYPDGWHVRAELVGRPEQAVEFYQSGCFSAMNTEVEVVGKAKKKWEVKG